MNQELINIILIIGIAYVALQLFAEIEKVKKGTGEYIKFIIDNTQFGYTPQGFENVDEVEIRRANFHKEMQGISEVASFLSKWNTYLSSLTTNDSLNPFTDNIFASMITEIRGIPNKDKLYETLNSQFIKKTPGKPDIALGDVMRTIIDKTTIGVTGQVPQVVAQQAAEENVSVLTPQSQYALQQGRDSQSVETQISQQPMILDAGTLTQINQTGQVPQMPQQARQLGLQPENPVYSNVPNTQVYQTPQLTTERGNDQTQAQMFQNTETNTFTIPEAEIGIVGASNLVIENGYYTEKSLKRDFDLQYLKPILTEQYKEKPFGVIDGGLFAQANF